MNRFLLALALLPACAPATHVGANHPARPDAPVGRLAGPPPALRKGVAAPAPAPAPPPAADDHGGHGAH